MLVEENGKKVNKFYTLDLEMNKIAALTLSWTLVHPITENSPLFNFGKTDYETNQGEILIFIKTFDEMFSTTVASSTSYTFSEFIYGAKFDLMYSENDDTTKTILHLDKLNSYKTIEL